MISETRSSFPSGIADPVQYFAFAHRLDQLDPLPVGEMSRVDQHKLHFMADDIDPELIDQVASAGLLRAIDILFEEEMS